MKLIRTYSPLSDLAGVSHLNSWLRSPFASLPSLTNFLDRSSFSGQLATDVHEDKENYIATFEVPGVKKEDVKIDLKDRLLTVSVERRVKDGEAECSHTSSRSITVPDSVNAETISAKLENGLLSVTLPKSEERKPRSISVS